MRAPLPWLREYVAVPPGAGAVQVAADLVRVGLEEEAVHGGDVSGPLVVGRIEDFTEEPQRNGRTIRWCSVHVGEPSPRGIVCGASNFRPGDLVVVSLPGAVLPGGFAIAARRTYGHVSDGMICSARELGLGEDDGGILRLAEVGHGDARPGDDAIALLGLDEETVEVTVTPDRGYALSLRGIAREYHHATGAAFADPADPAVVAAAPVTADGIAVELDDPTPVHGVAGCDRFVARVVAGLDPAAPTPDLVRRRLEQAGMRSISLAVDVTNYVMLAVGQPLHAYDLATLVAPVVVRRARAGERLLTLDGTDRALHAEDLLVSDSDGGRGVRALGLAGVMGGARTEVSATTTDVLVEAAHFDAVSVARTVRRHGLPSEAARRFERGVDPDLPARAAELAVRLLVEHGGGTAGPVTDVDRRPVTPAITMPADLPARLVGVPFTRDEVIANLRDVGCTVTVGTGRDAAELAVTPPSWRPDLTAPADLVEEVARLGGYDRIPSVLPTPPPGRGLTTAQRARRSVSRALAEHGLVEVLSYPFVAPGIHDDFGLDAGDARRRALRLTNPLSQEQPELRTSLLPPLLDTVRRNVARGTSDLGLFEVGTVVRPAPGTPAAPVPAVGRRPAEEVLDAIAVAVPPQPLRVAGVLTGQRRLPGWDDAGRAASWTDAVQAARTVGDTLGITLTVTADTHAPWHPGRCARVQVGEETVGHAGELDPRVLTRLGLPLRTVAFELALGRLVELAPGVRSAAPLSTFPVAKEDVALVVAGTVPTAAVEAALREGAGDLLESVRLFDVYVGPQIGEGRKSLAFSLRLRAPDRTLTAAELAGARAAAVTAATERTGAVLRGT